MKAVHSLLPIALAFGATLAEGRGSDVESSEALMVARAAGFKVIRDVTPKEASSEAAGGGESPLTSLLATLPAGHLENSPRFLAWMPEGLAASPKTATDWLAKVWAAAVSKTLPAAHVELKQRDVEKSSETRRYIAVDAPECAACMMLVPGIDIGRQPKTGKQPEFLGTSGSYVWGPPGQRGEGSLDGYPWTAESMTPDERIDFMRRLSGNLPSWVYLYIPPDPKFSSEPELFNTGRVLKFVQQ
jgi:hypothetical protein